MGRLIERNFPYAHLSVVAEAESWRKEIHRPIYYIHKWWARRLGSVFRGVILGACLDEAADFWGHFYGKNNLSGVVVFDPFMGSGVTIGEAIKLGCEVIGRDINPVSYLACRASFTKYNTDSVIATYREIEKNVSSKLLRYFETRTESGEVATVLYYFLVKMVPCPQCDEDIDLFKSRIFSKNAIPSKDPNAHAICPNCERIDSTRYDSISTTCMHCGAAYNPQSGNIEGSRVQCDKCDHAFRLTDRMAILGHPLKYRRYAKMVLTADGRKQYSSMNAFDRKLEIKILQEYSELNSHFPRTEIKPGYNTNQLLRHSYQNWHELFSDRQLVCIYHLREAIRNIDQRDLKLLFSCLFSGVLEFNNLFASFKGEGTGAVRHMFSNHILKPEMMPIEANLWGTSKSSGSFSTLFNYRIMRALSYKNNPTELLVTNGRNVKMGNINLPVDASISGKFSPVNQSPKTAFLSQGDSSCTEIPDNSVDIVATDPPFFDNIHYSQLADFFYYWLNQTLDYSSEVTTRQDAEVQDTHSAHFTAKLTAVFSECKRVLVDDGILVFTYHHARQEGWSCIHRAIRHAGFVCWKSYPIKSEMSVSLPLGRSKTPIHIDLIFVCRQNSGDNGCADGDFQTCDKFNIDSVLKDARSQVTEMVSAGIDISLGDAKVILMGCVLKEAHRIRNLEMEEEVLSEIEKNLEAYVANVLQAKGERPYKSKLEDQLILFEKIADYLKSGDA